MGGGINEIEDRFDELSISNLSWGATGKFSVPEGTYEKIRYNIRNNIRMIINTTYRSEVIYGFVTYESNPVCQIIYQAHFTLMKAEFSSDDTVEISPWDKIILNKNNWAGGTLQFNEEGIYNLLRTAITRYIPVYVTASSEYAILQYLDITTVSTGSGISGRYVIESQRTLRTIDMFVTTEDEVYLTIVNTEQLSNPI